VTEVTVNENAIVVIVIVVLQQLLLNWKRYNHQQVPLVEELDHHQQVQVAVAAATVEVDHQMN
jgi:hypothetical protein